MSPSVVAMAGITARPFVLTPGSWKSFYATLNGKYVGRQYYDNTSSEERSIPAYFVADFSMGYEIPVSGNSAVSLSFHVNNLFNRMYYADAWLWRAYFKQEDDFISDIGIYPQAPTNYMLKIAWRF